MPDTNELKEKFDISKEEYLAIIDKAMEEVKDYSASFGEEMSSNFSKSLYHRYVGVRLKFVGLTILKGMIKKNDELDDAFAIETRDSSGHKSFEVFRQLHRSIEQKFAYEQMLKSISSANPEIKKLVSLLKDNLKDSSEETEEKNEDE